MGWFRVSRAAPGDDALYRWKVLCFVTGGALGVAGMSSGRDWLVAVGIAVLAIGVALRLIRRHRREDTSD